MFYVNILDRLICCEGCYVWLSSLSFGVILAHLSLSIPLVFVLYTDLTEVRSLADASWLQTLVNDNSLHISLNLITYGASHSYVMDKVHSNIVIVH